jgi:hypothetical protein
LYTRVSRVTKKELYQYIRDNNIPLLKYNFNWFFQYYVKKNKIKVISHHFSNSKIEGLTIIDEYGISFSFERDNPLVKQNFTLCHELGHFILRHSGSCFAESVDNQEDVLEREANIFSAVVLMPDIVLLSKIYYSCDSFQKVKEDLKVSRQALYFRLIDLLRVYQVDTESAIKQAVDEYLEGQNASLHNCFHQLKEMMIEEFNHYQPSLIARIKKRLKKTNFVTSQELPELLDQKRWNEIREVKKFKVWLVYNKGKSLAYVWDSNKLSEAEARRKANLELLVM